MAVMGAAQLVLGGWIVDLAGRVGFVIALWFAAFAASVFWRSPRRSPARLAVGGAAALGLAGVVGFVALAWERPVGAAATSAPVVLPSAAEDVTRHRQFGRRPLGQWPLETTPGDHLVAYALPDAP